MGILELARQYTWLGFTHVIPLGFDHILFIVSICLLSSDLRSILIHCTVFTLAHSISLALSVYNLVILDSKIIEPLIACSILFTSIENIVKDEASKFRLPIIFIFGLIHGMGFAIALKEMGVSENYFFSTFLFFNIGVELGQILVILTMYFFIIKLLNKKLWYKERIVYPVSALTGCVALYWTIERLFS